MPIPGVEQPQITMPHAMHNGARMPEAIILDLPKNVIERIYKYQQGNLTGQIKLNFNRGKIESYESMEHNRVLTMQ